MSLPILLNRRGSPVRTQLVLGTALLLCGCARGPRWSVVPKWGRSLVRVTLPKAKTDRPQDDAVGHATVRQSLVARSGNVFTAFINRKRPAEEFSDDPFLNDPLAQTAADRGDSAGQEAIRTRPTATPRSSPIRQVDVQTAPHRSRLAGNREVFVADQRSRQRDRNATTNRPHAEKTSPAADHDQMRRLRTAMKTDQHDTSLSHQAAARAAKVRVGHMLRDVHALRQKGNLSEAYQTALSAKILAKTSRLFYGPDDEQPGDLVHQLRRELRAAGHETPVAMPSLPSRLSPPAVAERGDSPTGLPSRHRLTKNPSGPPPVPEFTPPDLSLSVARSVNRTIRSGGMGSAGQAPDRPAKVAAVKQTQTPSERVEILSPPPALARSERRSPSQTTVLKPASPTPPRVLTNSAPAPSIRPARSNRPLIVPGRQFLQKRTETGSRQSTQRDQTTGRVRQTSLITDSRWRVQDSIQPNGNVPDARFTWNRKTEPAVLLPSLLNATPDTSSVCSAQRRQVCPAPAPPVEQPVANPAGEAAVLPSNKALIGSVTTNSGSPSATASFASIDWSDRAEIDDDHAVGSKQTLFWLALAVAIGILLGVAIRTWTRFRGKPIQSHDS